MAINTAVPIYATPVLAAASFANADGTTEKTVVTAGSNGTRVDGLVVSSNDSAANSIDVWLNDGTTDHYLGNVAVPAGAGYTAPRVNALTTLAPGLVGAIILPTSWLLKVAMHAAVTATDAVTVLASGGNY